MNQPLLTRQQFLRTALAGAAAVPFLSRRGLAAETESGSPPAPVAISNAAPSCAVNVRDFGARGDGMAKDHPAIQAAIDSCAGRGGGTVFVPAGTYLCGTIELKSNIRLHLGPGAVIAASPDRADYRRLLAGNQFFTGVTAQPANHDEYLIAGFKAENVGITGPGTVDGRGHQFYGTETGERGRFAVKAWRPGPAVAFLFCRDVRLTDFSVRDHPFFAVLLHGCLAVGIGGLRIRTDFRFQNADGIHVASTRGLTITGCQIESEDDALCFYTNYWGLPDTDPDCTEVAVSNCVLASACSGIRVGFGADGRLGNMVFNNVVVRQADRGIDFIANANNHYQRTRSLAGPSIDGILFSNCVLADTNWGISGNIYGDAQPPAGIRNVRFDGLQVTSRRGNYLVGSKTIPVRDVTFRDAAFTVTGDLRKAAAEIPDPLPIYAGAAIPYGFFLRHAEDIAFRDCRLGWEGAKGDWRGGLHAVDGRNIDCRSLRVDRLHEDWASGVTATDAEVLPPESHES